MEIFVFGSNLAGRHGAGAALAALKDHGAIYGRGEGLQGQSYAIPTKDRTPWPSKPKTLPLYVIAEYITEFLQFSQLHLELTFNLTRIGCGLAGLPLLISGILFLIAAQKSRKDSLRLAPESDVMDDN